IYGGTRLARMPVSFSYAHWTRPGGRLLSGITSKTMDVDGGAKKTYELTLKFMRPSALPRSDRGTVTCMPSTTNVIGAKPTPLKHERCAVQATGSALVIPAVRVLAARSMP